MRHQEIHLLTSVSGIQILSQTVSGFEEEVRRSAMPDIGVVKGVDVDVADLSTLFEQRL